MSRNLELEGPYDIRTGGDKEPRTYRHKIYTIWYDCDCGRRLALMASEDGLFQRGPENLPNNVWKLTITGDKLSTTPSILNDHGDGQQCHFYITDEPFVRKQR